MSQRVSFVTGTCGIEAPLLEEIMPLTGNERSALKAGETATCAELTRLRGLLHRFASCHDSQVRVAVDRNGYLDIR